MMRLYFCSDIHGSEICFRKVLNAAEFYEADAVVVGGDLTAKMVVPVVAQEDGTYRVRIFGQERIAQTDAELTELERHIANNGFYAWRCTAEELREITASKQRQREIFDRLIRSSLRRWLELAEDRIHDLGVPFYVMPGNDDDPQACEILGHARTIENPESRVVQLPGGYEMISIGHSNRTPFDSPREMDEDDLYAHICDLMSHVSSRATAVFNIHCPPHDSGLDVAPELTRNLEVVTRGGRPSMVPVGSTSVRRAINEFQPLLGLHGHVHECRGATTIGRTLCINPGSEYAVGVLRGVLVNLHGSEVKGYQFVSG